MRSNASLTSAIRMEAENHATDFALMTDFRRQHLQHHGKAGARRHRGCLVGLARRFGNRHCDANRTQQSLRFDLGKCGTRSGRRARDNLFDGYFFHESAV